MFNIIFYEPRIPANTGNAIRMAAGTGCTLHLIQPLGFDLSDSKLKRAGLDYHELAKLEVHATLADCLQKITAPKVYAYTAHTKKRYDTVTYPPNSALIFGPEPYGLPNEILNHPEIDEKLRIPLLPQRRSLNLANAACLVTYEAWRQNQFVGSV